MTPPTHSEHVLHVLSAVNPDIQYVKLPNAGHVNREWSPGINESVDEGKNKGKKKAKSTKKPDAFYSVVRDKHLYLPAIQNFLARVTNTESTPD